MINLKQQKLIGILPIENCPRCLNHVSVKETEELSSDIVVYVALSYKISKTLDKHYIICRMN